MTKKSLRMGSSLTAANPTPASVSFPCTMREPLGYRIYRPTSGETLDQVLLATMATLGLKDGDEVEITVEVTKRRGA